MESVGEIPEELALSHIVENGKFYTHYERKFDNI